MDAERGAIVSYERKPSLLLGIENVIRMRFVLFLGESRRVSSEIVGRNTIGEGYQVMRARSMASTKLQYGNGTKVGNPGACSRSHPSRQRLCSSTVLFFKFHFVRVYASFQIVLLSAKFDISCCRVDLVCPLGIRLVALQL